MNYPPGVGVLQAVCGVGEGAGQVGVEGQLPVFPEWCLGSLIGILDPCQELHERLPLDVLHRIVRSFFSCPMPYTPTTFGWLSFAAVLASRMKLWKASLPNRHITNTMAQD